MRLTVIGCSGSMSGPTSPASCYLVQADTVDAAGQARTTSVVLDLGPGAMGKLLGHVRPAEIDLLAVSHLHADHVADLVGMQVYRKWHPDGPLPPLSVLGPTGTLERLRAIDGGDDGECYEREFRFAEHAPGRPVRVGPLTVESFPVNHPVEAYGVRITGPSSLPGGPAEVTLAYTGDTDWCDGLVPLAHDADLLLSEAAFQEGRESVRGVHLTGRRAGELATASETRRLVLTHIQPWTAPEVIRAEATGAYGGPIDVAAPDATWTL